MRRFAEKEMEQAGQTDDVYMREYVQNIDELLRVTHSASTTSSVVETEDTARSYLQF